MVAATLRAGGIPNLPPPSLMAPRGPSQRMAKPYIASVWNQQTMVSSHCRWRCRRQVPGPERMSGRTMWFHAGALLILAMPARGRRGRRVGCSKAEREEKVCCDLLLSLTRNPDVTHTTIRPPTTITTTAPVSRHASADAVAAPGGCGWLCHCTVGSSRHRSRHNRPQGAVECMGTNHTLSLLTYMPSPPPSLPPFP